MRDIDRELYEADQRELTEAAYDRQHEAWSRESGQADLFDRANSGYYDEDPADG